VELTVSIEGDGSGYVTDNTGGIDCGADCAENFNEDSIVTLVALPDNGSTFAGWTGDCEVCSDEQECNVTMTQDMSCQAEFSVVGPVTCLDMPPVSIPETLVIDFCRDECLETSPVRISDAIASICFNYALPVDAVVGFMDKNFEKRYWLGMNNGACVISRDFSVVIDGGQSMSCDADLPADVLDHGIVFWLVSGIPLESLDWVLSPYELLMYYIGE
jgi:hypothetical protein